MTNPLLAKIKEGVLAGDWQIICDLYNKMTGEEISPPIVQIPEPTPEPFNHNKAKKAELVEEVVKLGMDREVAKKTKVNDLRETYELLVQALDYEDWEVNKDLQMEATEVREEQLLNQVEDGFWLDESRPDTLEYDKVRAQQKLTLGRDLGEFGTEGTTQRTPSRMPSEQMTVRGHCPVCNSQSEIPSYRAFQAPGGELSGTCINCEGVKR